MLILRRKAGESIVIGDEIKVTVIDINEGSIRLAVEAPRRITVLRSELLQAADANRDAARQPASPQSLLSLLPQDGAASPQRGRGRLPGGRPRRAEADRAEADGAAKSEQGKTGSVPAPAKSAEPSVPPSAPSPAETDQN